MNYSYKRGSEWRKWDLHVHTPMSDGYKGNWEQFKVQLTNNDCDVIGINDYCSVEGFRKIQDDIKENNIKLEGKKLLPVVEMRMTDSVQNKHKSNGATHFNFHIIFSDETDIEDIENFIKALKSENSRIGTDYNDKSKLKNKKVSFRETLRELKDEKKFKNKFIIWLPYDEYGGIDEINPKTDSWLKQDYTKKSDILGSSNKKQTDFFLWKDSKFTNEQYENWLGTKKACIKGSDSHRHDYPIGKLMDKMSQPIEKYCWIKADPTFEGLKQIICEPEDRVRIQANKPEEKSGYQVIESITVKDELCNQEIKFNPNLNAIIGGRSTGKSTLLKVLAKKIAPQLDLEDDLINSVAGNSTVKWQDQEKDANRDIEFFPQNSMYEIAYYEEKKDRLIEKIVREKDEQNLMSKFESFCISNESSIQKKIDSLFEILDNKRNIESQLKDKGDKKGVEKEIQSIKDKINDSRSEANINQESIDKFETLKSELTENLQNIENHRIDIQKLHNLKGISIIDQSILYKLGDMSVYTKDYVEILFKEISQESQSKWEKSIDKQISDLESKIERFGIRSKEIEKSNDYVSGKKHASDNQQYQELSERLEIEEKKLNEINSISDQLEPIKISINQLIDQIIDYHLNFKIKTNELTQQLEIVHDDIQIQLKEYFLKEKCKGLIEESINLKSKERKDFVEEFIQAYSLETRNAIQTFVNELINQKIELKGYRNHQDLLKAVLIKNWFSITYRLNYQNDTFERMSDGKKAFVVLKLLLEFSDKNCPILIDQPEDSLDNRAIYNELVKYIKEKKKKRQIILVTHNANVVVNADAEEVIVANQHGEKSENTNDIKFEYVSGSLENTFPKVKSISTILHSQGIREHVCEILEGGTEAFKKREDKYGIK